MQILKDWQRQNYYNELVFQGNEIDPGDDSAPRLVVLVRDDILPPIAIGIQAAHAIISLSQNVKIDARCYIILLGATLAQIDNLAKKIYNNTGYNYASYIDNGLVDPETGEAILTACAFEPMIKEEVKYWFGKLRRAE